jgi:rhamnogalacturonyl hydrolase YesR
MLPKRLKLVALLALLFATDFVGAAEKVAAGLPHSPEFIGELVVTNLLARDYMFYGDEALHYAEAAAAVGALRFAARTSDTELLQRLIRRYENLLQEDSALISRRPHVDMNVIGIVPLQIAILLDDSDYRRQGLSFADSQWDDPRKDGLTKQTRWWIDDLYMVGMLQMQAFRATGDDVYADRAARQLAAYLPVLQRDNGLFYHSPDAPIFWGRGNGWVAVAMAEVLASLPSGHELREPILKHYLRMMNSLRDYQAESGMWRQVVDHEPSWAESSATAMFAYAMIVGIQSELLAEEPYQHAVDRAWAALAARVDAAGNLDAVCIGTGKNNDLAYYLARPTVAGDFHGQAPLLWLATALLDQRLGARVQAE